MRRSDDDPVVLTPGVGTRLLAFVSPALLFGLVALGYSRSGGLSVLGVVLLVLGVILLGSALFDQPLSVEIGPGGITRRAAVRTRHLPWSEVSALTRLPQKRRGGGMARALGGPPDAGGVGGKGLMARVGTKRVMLLDTTERVDEWELLTSSVRRWSPGCGLPPRPAAMD